MAGFSFAAGSGVGPRGGGFTLDIHVDGSSESDLALAMQGRLEQEIKKHLDRLEAAYPKAMGRVVADGKAKLRADIVGGGFYRAARLANTWQGRVYPSGKRTLEPAGWLASRAKLIIEAFSLGAVITVRNGKYLAIPQGPAKAVLRRLNQGKNRTRDGGGKFAKEDDSVSRVAAALGVRTKVIIGHNGKGVIVAESGATFTPTGRMAKNQAKAATVLFVLTRTATLKKRIRGPELFREIEAAFPAEFAAALAAELGPEDR